MTGSWRRWAWPVGIAAVALAIRLAFFTGLQGGDDRYYSASAHQLAHGDFSLHSDLFRTRLGYVGPVALLYALFGVHVGCLVAVNLASSMLLVLLAFRWGRELHSEPTGRAAALFVAVLPLDVFHATESHADLPAAAWASLGFYLFWAASRSAPAPGRTVRAIAGGLALGAAHLTKESAFLLVLPMIPFAFSPQRQRLALVTGGVFAAVILLECALYGVATGDPLYRVHLARQVQAGIPQLGGSFWDRLLSFPLFCVNPSGIGMVYTGGGFTLSAVALVWALRRDRQRSGWIAAWWLATGLLLSLWPISWMPYRPAMILHSRVFAPLVLPGALLAARFFSEAGLAVRPRIAWSGAIGFAVVALGCTFRLHQDGVRWRAGAEWASDRLESLKGTTVVSDPRTAEMLRIMKGYAPAYRLLAFGAGDPVPPAGTILVDNERMVETSREDGCSPPAWWRTAPPAREQMAEKIFPAPFRLRGPRRADERAVISRILPDP